MQIPQVMREFVTRGVCAIQEWEPDQGLEPEGGSSSCQAGLSCSVWGLI